MHVYTSHRRSAGLFEPPELVLVKEGFCWPAFLFTVLWTLWHRMWLAALLLLLAQGALGAVATAAGLHPLAEAALSLGFMLFVGFGGNDWRRGSLRRRRFADGPVVAAADRDMGEWRLLEAETRTGAI